MSGKNIKWVEYEKSKAKPVMWFIMVVGGHECSGELCKEIAGKLPSSKTRFPQVGHDGVWRRLYDSFAKHYATEVREGTMKKGEVSVLALDCDEQAYKLCDYDLATEDDFEQLRITTKHCTQEYFDTLYKSLQTRGVIPL